MKRLTPLLVFCASVLALPVSASAQAWGTWQNSRYRPVTQATTYRLPFNDALPVHVDQGPNGVFSHDDAANRDAIDFALPAGTPVLAAREGRVVQLRNDLRENYPARPANEASDAGDFVRIRHADGSAATYAHLQAGSLRVQAGQYVQAGDCIALSGNTGFSTAPHLHFVVQIVVPSERGTRLQSVPVRIDGPQGELEFPQVSR